MNKVTSRGVTKAYFSSTRKAYTEAKKLSELNAKNYGDAFTAEVFTGHHLATFANGKRVKTLKVCVTANEHLYY